jgi:GT2 family glycosyltransferase
VTSMKPVANLTAAISTFDRPAGLARCLYALLSGDVLPAEVIVVDQGLEAARSIVEQHRAGPVPIIYVRQEKRGLAASRNLAFRRAHYPVVAVTDDDCAPDPGWIAAIDRAFAAPSPPDAVTGRVLPRGPDESGMYEVSSRAGNDAVDFHGRIIPWIVGTGGNSAVRRDWFDRVGGFDERLGAGSPGKAAEDLDFFYRLLRVGGYIRYDPDAIIYHERQTKERRLATRFSYAYGISAFCGISLSHGDAYALRILGRWLRWQTGTMTDAILRRNWLQARQSWLSLAGTACGLIYGLRANRQHFSM